MIKIITSLYYIFRLRRRFYGWSEEQIIKHQQKRLAKLAKYLQTNSKFYKKVIKSHDDFNKIPIIDKGVFMENFDYINTVGLKKEKLLKFSLSQQRENNIDLYENKYSVGLSSGTSGNVTLTVLSEDERKKYPLLLLARTNILSYVKKPKVLFLLRRNNAAFMEVNNFGVKIIYADYTVIADKLIELINNHGINVIAGPPSLLCLIGKKKNKLKMKIDLLVSYAEVLSDKVKENLTNDFKSKLIEIYQGAEGFLAATCPHGRLHLNEDTTYFEFENVDENNPAVKRVVVTDLYRTAVPFVRYSLHDVMELDSQKCSCGSNFRIIRKIHGREDDIFILKSHDGEKKYLFPDYVRRSINQASEKINEFQAIQKINGDITIRLVLDQGANKREIEDKIFDNMNFWVNKINAIKPRVNIVYEAPVKNKNSHKLIRVMREK